MKKIKINTNQFKTLLKLFENTNNDEFIIKNFNLTNSDDYEYIKNNSELLWGMIQKAYSNIGGFKSFKNIKEMLKRSNLITLGYYNNIIVAVSLYNNYLGGNKEVAIAAITGPLHKYGVVLVEQIIQRNIKEWQEWYWVEASSKIEELYLKNNGLAIPNIYIRGIFPNKEITLNDDEFHYHRTIGGEPVENDKMLFGVKDLALKEAIELDFPLGYADKIEKIKKRILSEASYTIKLDPMEVSKLIVDMFIDDYNDGLTQVSLKNLIELRNNLKVLRKGLIFHEYPNGRHKPMKLAYDDGMEVLNNLKIIKVFHINDNYKKSNSI